MGDRGHNRHGQKRQGRLLCPFRCRAGSPSNTMWPGRGLLPYQAASSSIQPFGHNRHGPKTGSCAPFRGELRSHLTQRRLGRCLYLRTKWHFDPFSRLATIDMGLKFSGEELCTFFLGGTGCLSNTKSPGPRPTCMPSFILIHPTVWPQYLNVKSQGKNIMVCPITSGDHKQTTGWKYNGLPYSIGRP